MTDEEVMRELIESQRCEIERLRARKREFEEWERVWTDKDEERRAEIKRLRLDLHHYEALQTAYHNANRVIEQQEAENAGLRAALREIERWNNRTSLSEPRLIAKRALEQIVREEK